MNDNLDKWIKDAKIEVPDPGEYRRLNRAMIKEGMFKSRPDRRRHLLLVAASVVFLMLMSGQISQLGSDDFERSAKVEDTPDGRSVTVYTNEFSKQSVSLPGHFSDQDRDEFYRSSAAGEGEITRVTGLSYGGKTQWLKHVRRIINDKESNAGESTTHPVSVQPDDFVNFLMTHYKALRSRSDAEPPHQTTRMEVDGVLIDFKIWTYEYPEYGLVTRYDGLPVTTP